MTARKIALLFFLVAAGVYLFPLAYNHFRAPFFALGPGSDVIPTSLIPFSLLRDGDFFLDEYSDFFNQIASNWQITDMPYFVARVNNHLVSDYPIVAAILALPFAGLVLGTRWITTSPTDALYTARFAAALMTACTVTLFFLTSHLLSDRRTAILVTLGFAFGTSIWSTQSQSLWQHTPSVLLQTIALWLLARGRQSTIPLAGLFLAAAAVARPNNVTTAIVLAVYVFIEHRQAFPGFLLCAAIPAALGLTYNWAWNGNPLLFGFEATKQNQWIVPSLSNALGLLFSPSRGLLIFSPFLALVPLGLWFARRDSRYRFYLMIAVAGAIFFLVLTAWRQWYGGWDYGPRLLSDILPLLCLLIVPAIKPIRGIGLVVLLAAIAHSMFLQALGLWDYGLQWHYAHQQDPNLFWTWRGAEPVFYLDKYAEMLNRFLRR